MTWPYRILVVPAFLLLLLAQTLLAEVPVIANGETPTGGLLSPTLEELWRIGGDEDEENLLGVIDKALADDQGNVYLLDIQLVEVQVYDAAGTYLQSYGKRGDGPGEVRRASDFLFMPDGTLGLVQAFPGRIVQLDLEGLPAGELKPGGDEPTAGGFFALRTAASVGNHLVFGGLRMIRGDNTRTAHHFIANYDLTGAEGASYLTKTTEREFRSGKIVERDDYFPHRGGWALGPDGRVVVAPERNSYRLEWRSPDGQLERVVTRPYESWKRTDAEMARAKELMTPFRRRNRGDIDVVLEDTERDILDLRIDSLNRVWVLPSRGARNQPAGVHSTWDVFAPDGTFVNQVAIACDGRGLEDALFFPGGNLVILVREHADAMFAFQGRGADNPAQDQDEAESRPLEVICYRLNLE